MTLTVNSDDIDNIVDALNTPTIADWIAAGAAVLTFGVALFALWYAAGQVKVAREARKDAADLETKRAQPYVVAYMEPSAATDLVIDIVIKNFGATVAHDVKITFTEPPQRSKAPGANAPTDIVFPEVISALAPGQEWRTMWDHGPDRNGAKLADKHVGQIAYTGLEGKQLQEPVVLDWGPHRARHWVEVRGIHDAAKALREIDKTTKKWTENARGRVSVVVRDGDKKDKADTKEYRQWAKEQEAAKQAALDAQAEGSQGASDEGTE